MSCLADPGRLLLRALTADAARAAVAPVLSHDALVPWASATFVGGQHRVLVTGTALDGWLAALPEAELPLRGHFVASCEVAPTPTGAVLTVLVLEG